MSKYCFYRRIQRLSCSLWTGGIIASIKRHYRKRQLKRAIQLIERGVCKDIYSLDLYTAIKTIYDIWDKFDPSIVKKCWIKTGLIDAPEVLVYDNSSEHNNLFSPYEICDILE